MRLSRVTVSSHRSVSPSKIDTVTSNGPGAAGTIPLKSYRSLIVSPALAARGCAMPPRLLTTRRGGTAARDDTGDGAGTFHTLTGTEGHTSWSNVLATASSTGVSGLTGSSGDVQSRAKRNHFISSVPPSWLVGSKRNFLTIPPDFHPGAFAKVSRPTVTTCHLPSRLSRGMRKRRSPAMQPSSPRA